MQISTASTKYAPLLSCSRLRLLELVVSAYSPQQMFGPRQQLPSPPPQRLRPCLALDVSATSRDGKRVRVRPVSTSLAHRACTLDPPRRRRRSRLTRWLQRSPPTQPSRISTLLSSNTTHSLKAPPSSHARAARSTASHSHSWLSVSDVSGHALTKVIPKTCRDDERLPSVRTAKN